MYYVLENIGYKNIDLKYNYRFNTYALYFIPELINLIIMFLLFYEKYTKKPQNRRKFTKV